MSLLSVIKYKVLRSYLFLIHLKYRKKIKSFKSKYDGKRCFIVGNGPSLRTSDLKNIKNEISFGTHRIYNIFSKTSWRPTFYVAQDFELIKESLSEIEKYKDEYKQNFLPLNIYHNYSNLIKNSDNISFFDLRIKQFFPDLPDFSEDIEQFIFEGMTVTYACIQLAVYMGFKEIYLLGVDHNYSVIKDHNGNIIKNDIKDYFEGGEENLDITKLNIPQTEKSTLAYIKAKKYCEDNDIKIYNATRGGKLEVFERKTLEEIFNN